MPTHTINISGKEVAMIFFKPNPILMNIFRWQYFYLSQKVFEAGSWYKCWKQITKRTIFVHLWGRTLMPGRSCCLCPELWQHSKYVQKLKLLGYIYAGSINTVCKHSGNTFYSSKPGEKVPVQKYVKSGNHNAQTHKMHNPKSQTHHWSLSNDTSSRIPGGTGAMFACRNEWSQ